MLDYGLPSAPEGHRWFIRGTIGGKEYRYLHLEKRRNFLGIKWHSLVHKGMINTGTYCASFETETRNAAHRVLKEVNVNFNLPTGEVK